MVTNNKVLTVSYGTFSCTLEGFEDNFETMKAIAEYFRDLAADDRYFGAEPPTPDAEMLARIAEREIDRRVQARTDQGTLVLTAGDAIAQPQDDVSQHLTEEPLEDLEDEIAEGEETLAIDEDQLAEEREAFFAEVDSVAEDHAADVADEVAAHSADANAAEEHAAEVIAEDVHAEESVDEDLVEHLVAEVQDPEPQDIGSDQDEHEVQAHPAPIAPAASQVSDEDDADDEDAEDDIENLATEIQDDAQDEEDAFEDEETESFFAGAKAKQDSGVSSIAAKLSRIRAVVSKAEQDEDGSPYSEDEHAENPAADFLRKSASDIEGSLEEEDDIEAVPPASTGRVIRMRRSQKPVEAEDTRQPEAPAKAPVAPPVAQEPVIEDEVLAEDTVAEFENGYAKTELDAEDYDEEILESTPPSPRPRANLAEDVPQKESVDRLLNEANTKLEDPDTSRRRTTLAHLRAAVAATRAEKNAGTYEGDKDQSGAYREDLADVMRPRRSATAAVATDTEAPAEDNAAPLRLVASQRVDADVSNEESIRPRRVSPADIQSFEPKEQSDFIAYAEEVGATELPDILEAAASYLTYVEGRRRFSRPMLMRLAYQLGPERFQREAGLRSFGQLLRDKKIEKIAGGRFTAAETIRFKPESAAS